MGTVLSWHVRECAIGVYVSKREEGEAESCDDHGRGDTEHAEDCGIDFSYLPDGYVIKVYNTTSARPVDAWDAMHTDILLKERGVTDSIVYAKANEEVF